MRKTTHVIPNKQKGGCDIKQGGAKRSSAHFDRKSDAIDKARQLSQNNKSELVIHNKDRKIARRDSHGNDPYPPRG